MAVSLSELVRVQAGRPVWVAYEGGRVYISPHDEGHRQTKAEYKRLMVLAHPDPAGERVEVERKAYTQRSRAGRVYTVTAGTMRHASRREGSTEFRRLRRRYEAWLRDERAWYAQFGLGLP